MLACARFLWRNRHINETVTDSPYYYAYASRIFCEVGDESTGYKKFAHFTNCNNADQCVRLITAERTGGFTRMYLKGHRRLLSITRQSRLGTHIIRD
jgi:hypothetical protein